MSKYLRIIEYNFRDININGDNPGVNSMFWIGNEEKWLEIMRDL